MDGHETVRYLETFARKRRFSFILISKCCCFGACMNDVKILEGEGVRH